MSINKSLNKEKLYASSETTFFIVGPRRLQNELIAACLEKETRTPCIVVEDIHQIPTDSLKPCSQPSLIVWDFPGEDLKRLLAELNTYISRRKLETRAVFFNVSKHIEFKKKFVLKGIHGFFYEHDSLDIFLKGVEAVIEGKLWLSREMMTRCIFEGNDTPSKSTAGNLTERQIEILALIAVGATNDEIADRLCISPHTVKTHLYRIFKKINVPNRVQASLWAAKNL
jgi:LuxR family transcriptional regulator of csgAB operon